MKKANTPAREKQSINVYSKLTAGYLAVMLFAYLLFTGFSGYGGIYAQKYSAFCVLSVAYVALTLLIKIERVIIGAEKLRSPIDIYKSLNIAQKLVILYLILAVLSTLTSPFFKTSLLGSTGEEGLLTIALYCLCFLLISASATPRRWMAYLFFASVSINSIIALIQLAGYNPLGLYPDGVNYYDANKLYPGTFLGTIGNVDLLAGILCLSIPAMTAAVIKTAKVRNKLLICGALMLSLAVLVLSPVAGAILGAVGGVVISIPILVKGKHRRVAVIVIAVILLLTLIAVYFFGASLGGTAFELSELMHGRWNDHFGSGRIYIWRNVLDLIAERPILGGGPDTLGLRREIAFERYDEALGLTIHSTVNSAHNEYLNILVNQGALSLLAYLALLCAALIRWVKRSKDSAAVCICGCAVVGYCIQALFEISSPLQTPYLWIALALLCSLSIDNIKGKGELK